MRDFAIKDNSLVVATHGRSFWVIDDLSPLRQADERITASDAYLFKPPVATRMRPGGSNGTPLPMGTAVASNPPDGAMIDYYLKAASSTPVTLEILDSSGQLVRRYSSADQPFAPNPRSMDIPAVWLRTPPTLSAAAGMHQWLWDLRYAAPAGAPVGRFGGGGGPWVLPGEYTVKLTVGGKSYTQPLTVKLDPRVQVTPADLTKQFDLARKIAASMAQNAAAQAEARQLRQKIQSLRSQAAGKPAVLAALDGFDRKMQAIVGAAAPPNPDGAPEESPDRTSLLYLQRQLSAIANSVNGADAAPTAGAIAAFGQVQQVLPKTLAAWAELKSRDLPQLNTVLRDNSLPPVQM